MEVNKISANIRYSQDSGKGSWKVVELGAEANIGEREDWKQSQSELYHQLTHQLRSLWTTGNSNGSSAVVNGQDRSENHVEPPAEPEPKQKQSTRLHWCAEHQLMFKRRQKAGTVWFSHKAPDGSWCSEPERAGPDRRT